MPNDALRSQIDLNGFALVPGILAPHEVDALLDSLDSGETAGSDCVSGGASERRRQGAVYARRNILDFPAVRDIARSKAVRDLVESVLGPGCFAVRGLLFDKTPEANWKVIWHQDLSIAVREQRDTPGFGPWSEKAGVTHVQPPMPVLERMLAVRLHLDDCDETNGPLRVLPATHKEGRLDAARIAALRERIPETVCLAPRGGALLMRPLLLHASSAARTAKHRRVLHLEWATEELPDGLEWRDVVGK